MLFANRYHHIVDRLRPNSPVPLRLKLWDGHHFDFSHQPTVTVAIPKPSALKYFISPTLGKLGEAFVEGHIRVEGSIHEIFRVADGLARTAVVKTNSGFSWLKRHTPKTDRKAIEYHYDVSNDFYRLFLDRNMVYSCAYFRDAADSLETAQEQKLDHILSKLLVKPGERLLDIGCGWGALVMRAAKKYGADATGITLSKNQYEYACERIRAEGLQDRCRVELRDYRDLPDDAAFDKISSVGMFEHVGLRNLPVYFQKIRNLLKPNGLVLNHGITSSGVDKLEAGPDTGSFIDRYVFPDGELPHISLVMREMAAAGLEVADVESLRRHYARTCHEWASRLEARQQEAANLIDEKKLRIWQIYLAGSAFGFAKGWMNLYQILAGRASDHEAQSLPLTREYMYGA
ncbi:MAG: class I SAM-dependent methyltransferase [Betaproteobacteria bacterium]